MWKQKREPRRGVLQPIIAAAGGALLMYLFDPRLGRTRRSKLQDQMGGLFRRSARQAARKAEYVKGQVEGIRHVSTEEVPANDAALTAKVESEVLSRDDYPKGQINVNSVDGVVELRGVCETPDQIADLEQQVRKVTGVVDVRNFLHLPNTPSPHEPTNR